MGLRRVLNIDFVITNEPRGFYGVESRAFLTKKPGESLDHVVMKLLSYVVFFDPELEIEASVGQHYKPDLVRTDERGEVVQWIDCGSTSIKKLDQITQENSEAIIKIVKPTPRTLQMYKQQADLQLSFPERVHYVTWDRYYVERVGELLHRRHTLTCVVSPEFDHLYLNVDDIPTNSAIHYLRGGRAAP
jgi:uncharacterized protein YaeQ